MVHFTDIYKHFIYCFLIDILKLKLCICLYNILSLNIILNMQKCIFFHTISMSGSVLFCLLPLSPTRGRHLSVHLEEFLSEVITFLCARSTLVSDLFQESLLKISPSMLSYCPMWTSEVILCFSWILGSSPSGSLPSYL